jgi:hypothetical protein
VEIDPYLYAITLAQFRVIAQIECSGPIAPGRISRRSLEVRMRKLKLELDTLTVQSFHTGDTVAPAGTVKGHAPPTQIFCTQQFSCATYCGATGCPVESIDIGCISDPTRCGGCQDTRNDLCG